MNALVVEDDPSVGPLAVELLLAQGYDARLAASVEEAYDALILHEFDLLILDLKLGHSSGEVLVERLKADRRSLPRIVLFSGEAPTVLKEVAQRLGAVAVCRKPCAVNVLLQAIETAISAKVLPVTCIP